MKTVSVLAAVLRVNSAPIENSNGTVTVIDSNETTLLEFINEKRSWKDAKSYCAQSGAHLMHVKTEADQTRLENLTGSSMAWIGARKTKNGSWEWLDGESLSDHFDNFNYEWGDGGDCARKTKVGAWFMSDCEYVAPFVCQRSRPLVVGSFGGVYKYADRYSAREIDTLEPVSGLVRQDSQGPLLSNHCTVFYRGEVWSFGGSDDPSASYRLTNGVWTEGPRMPRGRVRHSCAVHEKKVWICGGTDETGEPLYDCIHFVVSKDTLGLFGHDLADFLSGPGLAETRPRNSNLVSTTRGLYIIGGTHDARMNEIVPTGMAQWAPTSPLPFTLIEATAGTPEKAVLDDVIYLIGGILDNGEESGNVFALGPNSAYWEWAGALSQPRSGHAAVPIPGAGKIIISGGRGIRGDEVWFRNDTSVVSEYFEINRLGGTMLTLPGSLLIEE